MAPPPTPASAPVAFFGDIAVSRVGEKEFRAERIRIGGNVQATKVVRQVRPVYPEALKSQGITGTVMLRAVISVTGEPLNVEVVNTAVNYGLAQAALEAVRQWRYQPTLLNGQPVEVPATIDVVFELEK